MKIPLAIATSDEVVRCLFLLLFTSLLHASSTVAATNSDNGENELAQILDELLLLQNQIVSTYPRYDSQVFFEGWG